ncbi:MAG: carbohydrate-binding domain-containing protein [Clostridia bacterium]|nr:carbohydrate-binding domain-containing protein [Clostridia bacterium]
MKMKKRFWGILLNLVMALGLMIGMSSTAHAADLPITIDPVGGGTVTKTERTGVYECTAHPAEGYNFQNWTYTLIGEPKTDTSITKSFDSSTADDITAHFVKAYPLWVGGKQVTSANASDIFGDGKASYNAETKTLTLDGYSFSGTGYSYQEYSGAIYAGEGLDLSLVLSGTNSVVNNDLSSGMPCGIYAVGALTISGNGTLEAEAKQRGISCRGKLTIIDGSLTVKGVSGHGMFVDGDVEISGGTVSVEGASDGICSQGGSVTISGGEVTAKSKNDPGVSAQGQIKITGGKVTAETESRIGMSSSNVTIEGGEIIALGNEKGIRGTVVNAIPGTGWTNRDGTAGKAGIPVSASGQSLDYKKVQFPGESLPPAEVTKAPTAKTLTYTGSAQELVTAGTPSGGTMQYAIGTKDAATGSYTTSIPTGTDAGTYYVWYKVIGDKDHNDSTPACVTVTIQAAAATTAAPTAVPTEAPEKPLPKTGDNANPALWLLLSVLALGSAVFLLRSLGRKGNR